MKRSRGFSGSRFWHRAKAHCDSVAMPKFTTGFTLIELLVVIAIIGILASVVLASLSTARAKAADAKVKGQLSNLRSAAELYYSTNATYQKTAGSDSVCNPPSGDTSGLSQLLSPLNYPSAPICNDTSTSWVVNVSLSGNGNYWCVDSSGKSEEVDTIYSTVCP